ncbi:MAG: AI-2E family transporter [Spirochaetales bacterium]
MQTSQNRVRIFVVTILVAILIGVVIMLEQFLAPIVLAILLALLASPAYGWLRKKETKPNIAAMLVVIGTFLIVLIPMAGFLFLLVTQGVNIVRGATEQIEQGALQDLLDAPFVQQIRTWLEQTLPSGAMEEFDLADRLRSVAESAASWLVDSGVSVFGDLFNIISDFFILLFLLFFLVRDGSKMADGLRELLPLHGRQTDRLYGKVKDVTNAVVFGTLAIAALQGLLGGVGFWIVGLPGLVWGPVIGVASLVPIVGAGLVTIPAIVYLFLNQMWWQAIFFTLWAAVLVGGVDNYLRPFFMRGQARMSPFYIFLAVIGGLAAFGIAGLIFGPLIIAIAMVMVQIYREEFSSIDTQGRYKRWLRTHGTKGFGSRGRRAARRHVSASEP